MRFVGLGGYPESFPGSRRNDPKGIASPSPRLPRKLGARLWAKPQSQQKGVRKGSVNENVLSYVRRPLLVRLNWPSLSLRLQQPSQVPSAAQKWAPRVLTIDRLP